MFHEKHHWNLNSSHFNIQHFFALHTRAVIINAFAKSLDEESNNVQRERGKERDASLPTTACAERQTCLSKPFCFSGVVKDTVGQTSIRISCEVRLKAAQRSSCVRLRERRVISIKDEGYKQEESQRIGRERPSIRVNSGILTEGHQDDFRSGDV